MKASDVDRLVDAYQDTLREAKQRWRDGFDARVTLAIVAENAKAARRRLVMETTGGDRLTARLDAFLEEASPIDVVGKSLNAAGRQIVGAAKIAFTAVMNTALGLAAPPSLVAVVGLIATLTGVIQQLGQTVGFLIGAVVIAVAAFLPRYAHLLRFSGPAIASVTAAATQAVGWTTTSFVAAVSSVGRLGAGAEALVDEMLKPAASTFFGIAGSQPGWEQARKLRGLAQAVLFGAVAIIAACVVVFAFGFVDGLNRGLEQDPTPTIPTLNRPRTSSLDCILTNDC